MLSSLWVDKGWSIPVSPVVAFGIRAERFVFFPRLYMAKSALLNQKIHGENFVTFTSNAMGLLSQLLKSFCFYMAV
jgi:hypothetical protein